MGPQGPSALSQRFLRGAQGIPEESILQTKGVPAELPRLGNFWAILAQFLDNS